MDSTHYIVDANDPAMQQFIHRQASSGGAYVLLPQDFVVLADGRIGVPVKLAFPGGNQTFTKDDYRIPQAVQFAIFANVDGTGTWLLDQSIPLCTWKCDQYYADLQTGIDRDRQWLAAEALRVTSPVAGTPIAPVATPAGTAASASPASAEETASPVAADPWLQPITAVECATPTTTGRSEAEIIAVTSRWYLACGNERNNVQDVISFFSAELLARHPELLKGQYTLQAADIDSAKAVSSALASKNIQLLEQGVPGADDDTTRTSGFYEVFLPQNTVVLPDGRIAIPFTSAFPDPASFTRAKTSQAADPKAPQAAGALVFVKDGDTWKIDQFGAICIANCDGVWSEQETHVGTPSPSNDELATASAEAAKLLPIPPESCMVPTAPASASDLPNRSYNRLMMPTTNKADGAADAASNIIACLYPAPVATPATIQELFPPLITKRLQQELPANGDDPQLTMAQINGARDVSTYLEEQTTYKPFERAAEGVHDAPPDVWPSKLQGDSFDPTPGWYPIVLPENSIQFPDGRVGVPITYMITSDALWNDLGSRSSSGETSIYIFAPTEGAWKLDEVLPLCLGDCNAYWTEQEANIGTPEEVEIVRARTDRISQMVDFERRSDLDLDLPMIAHQLLVDRISPLPPVPRVNPLDAGESQRRIDVTPRPLVPEPYPRRTLPPRPFEVGSPTRRQNLVEIQRDAQVDLCRDQVQGAVSGQIVSKRLDPDLMDGHSKIVRPLNGPVCRAGIDQHDDVDILRGHRPALDMPLLVAGNRIDRDAGSRRTRCGSDLEVAVASAIARDAHPTRPASAAQRWPRRSSSATAFMTSTVTGP